MTSRTETRLMNLTNRYGGYIFKKAYPSWLKTNMGYSLELDMYNEDIQLAIEYDSPHHYEFPNSYHKTRAEFDKQQENDELKDKLCAENNVTLIRNGRENE